MRCIFVEIWMCRRGVISSILSPWRTVTMIRFFQKARNDHFKTRSTARNTESDHARVASIFRSIEDALEGTKAEQVGLKSRIDDAIARSAATLGNDSDEYLTRDPADNRYQN